MPDWELIRTEYVLTNTNFSALGRRHGVPRTTISTRANAGDWRGQRERCAQLVADKALEKVADHEADKLSRLILGTTKAVDVAVSALEDELQFKRYLVSQDSETCERVFQKVDMKALKDVTGVLRDLTGLMRDFYNLPTPAQAEARRVASSRLELEQQRAQSGAGGELTVRFQDTQGAQS